MPVAVSVAGVVASALGAADRALLGAAFVAAVIAPGAALAQQVEPRHRCDDRAASRNPRHRDDAAAATTASAASVAATAGPAQNNTTPAVPGAVDHDKIPANVQTVWRGRFRPREAPDLLEAMVRGLPGVALSDQTGNQFQLDLNYRGFVASPVIGTPQGLAIYQNGVRINEVFGDIVNWDFIPQNAINRLTLVPSNPVYGLNAIGGALSLEMKNGYTYHAVEGEVSGGSYGRVGASVQAGGQVGNLSGYITADAIDDAGWRNNSPSSLRRVYADLGARGDQTEFHVTFTGANNNFGAAAATPVQMLSQDWASIYTIPQTTQNQLAFLTASASWKPSDTWTYQAIAYYRNFQQGHVDGNGTDAQNIRRCPDPTVALLSQPRRHRLQPDDDQGTDRAEHWRAWLRAFWAKSTAPGPRPTASAARRRPRRRKSCSVTRTTSRSA